MMPALSHRRFSLRKVWLCRAAVDVRYRRSRSQEESTGHSDLGRGEALKATHAGVRAFVPILPGRPPSGPDRLGGIGVNAWGAVGPCSWGGGSKDTTIIGAVWNWAL